ncbi:MAG: hypothetical protein K2Q33_03730 [Gammaproteobacteria bacterium]|nr:hypothetical protein [Gammaproteobacteria bacterium]
MNVGLFYHRGYEIKYFILGDSSIGYSASAKVRAQIKFKEASIPLQLPDQTYAHSVAAEEAIMQLCKSFIDENFIETIGGKYYEYEIRACQDKRRANKGT